MISRNWGRLPLFFCLLLSLAACGWLASPERTDIVRPDVEEREYRHLTLSNGMQILLISDPEAEKAAAAMDVNVGSRHDPVDRQGLAHFLEHMLFLGTDKFPEPGEYQSFIAAHGGSHNAYAAFENTNYFFDISAEHLEPALDRFSRFFVAPLFNSEYVRREVNAVDSEYRTRILDDLRRNIDVMKEVANPDHPFAKFNVGSLATLLGGRGEEALREALLDFYERYYAAELMSLVVLGRESLDELESIVRPRFEPVAAREAHREPVTEPMFEDLPQWLEVEPHQQMRRLALHFPIPDVREYYRTKPFEYIANLLGHEGEGSLLSLLRERGWAEELSAGRSYAYHGGGLFGVTIELSEAGVAQADEIVSLVFETIGLIREAGVEEWRYREQQQLAEQQFRFRSLPSEIREVSRLSTNLQRYPAEDVIYGDYRMDEYRPALIAEMLEYLTLDNALLMLTAPGLETDRASEFYNAPYARHVPGEDRQQLWQRRTSGDALALPARNPFIASRLAMKEVPEPTALPVPVKHSPGVELWFKNDVSYGAPRGNLRLLLATDSAAASARQQALTRLWVRMVRDELNEFAYPAQLAGLNFSLQQTWTGIEVGIHGFDEKQALLLEQLAAVLGSPELDERRFERVLREELRSLKNRREEEPFRLASAELRRALQRNAWPLDELIEQSRELTLEDLREHIAEAMSATELIVLAHGNYRDEEARELADIAARYLRSRERPEPLREEILRMPEGEYLHTLSSNYTDAAVLLYLQGRQLGPGGRAVLGLMGQMLRSDFFHELRTEKQYGYVVTAGAFPQRDVPGLFFLAQSSTVDAGLLQREFEDFLQRWLDDEQARRAQFTQHRAALAQRLLQSPRNLREAGERYWSDLLDGYLQFDSREQIVEQLRELTFEDWLAAVRAELDPRHALWVVLPGDREAELRGGPLHSLPAFKREQTYHRFP